MKGKSISSQTHRDIRSATFDVDDGSCEGNAGSRPTEPCTPFLSTEAVEDAFDQQREPKETNGETRSSCGGPEDVCTEQEQPVVDAAEAVKADVTTREELKSHHAEEDEKLTAEGILAGAQDAHGDSPVNTAEDEGEAQTAKEREPDELPERPRSAAAETGTSEALSREGVSGRDAQETDDDDDDVGEKLQEVEEWVAQKNETKSVENNPSEADEDSGSVFTQHLIRSEMDDQVQKHESESVKYLKVSEGFCSHPAEAVVL